MIRLSEEELERISRNRSATNPEKHDVVIAIRDSRYSRGNSHHNVYVVELDPVVGRARSIRSLNPNRDPGKPCVYVGMTGLSPEERFRKHKAGIKASPWVRDHGIRLLPELFTHLNPMTYEEAVQREQDLAEELRREGYTVTGGH